MNWSFKSLNEVVTEWNSKPIRLQRCDRKIVRKTMHFPNNTHKKCSLKSKRFIILTYFQTNVNITIFILLHSKLIFKSIVFLKKYQIVFFLLANFFVHTSDNCSIVAVGSEYLFMVWVFWVWLLNNWKSSFILSFSSKVWANCCSKLATLFFNWKWYL